MSTNFKGYLFRGIKMVNNVKTYTAFPNSYIQFESFHSTPKQREELKAYRDDNSRELTRVTAEGMKSKFWFTVRPLWIEEKIAVQNFFYNHETDHVQRKVWLEYWDDDSNSYSEGYFYRPNLEFTISHVTDDRIKYKEQKLELIEY